MPVTADEWRMLLRIVLAQRLEMNAIESALKRAGALSEAELKAIRQQATDTAAAWSSKEDDDVMRLIRIHSLPAAIMLVPKVD